MDTKTIAKLKTLITKHTKAQIELSWVGGGDPENAEITKARAILAEAKLNKFLETLKNNPA